MKCQKCGINEATAFFQTQLLCKECYNKVKGVKKRVSVRIYSGICFGKNGQRIKITSSF